MKACAVDTESIVQGEEWRRRLQQVVGDHGGPSTVSRLSEVPLQTLKNHLNGRTKKAPLGDLKRIAETCGVSSGWLAAVEEHATPPARLSQADVEPFGGSLDASAAKLPAGHRRWLVKSRALELAGYLPGDMIEFDTGKRPRGGEPVVAQVHDDAGGAETVLRLYRPPFLTVHTADPGIDPRPIQLDPSGARVKMMGGFVQMIRQPPSS